MCVVSFVVLWCVVLSDAAAAAAVGGGTAAVVVVGVRVGVGVVVSECMFVCVCVCVCGTVFCKTISVAQLVWLFEFWRWAGMLCVLVL